MKWIKLETVLAIHDCQINEHGGIHGIRDMGLIESSIVRTKNSMLYGDKKINIPKLAVIYAYSLITNHGFVDGNKRTAYVVMRLFMRLNGYDIKANNKKCIEVFIGAANGEIPIEVFTKWVHKNSLFLLSEEINN